MSDKPRKPSWLDKHPCTDCATGYGECAQGLRLNLKCCKACCHPGRWVAEPYTAEDWAEMREQRRAALDKGDNT